MTQPISKNSPKVSDTALMTFTPSMQKLIDVRIESVNAMLAARTEFSSLCPALLREAMRSSLLARGKRVRPLFVLLACEVCGGNWHDALPAACAVEMIHAYSLIHDDLPALDNDDLRRGQPTCHIRFGEAMAILAGDALQATAFETLAALHAESVAPALAILSKLVGAEWLVGGQADDISVMALSENRSPEELRTLLDSIHDRKTGALIGASLSLGGVIAKASAAQHDALRAYGHSFGLAFQITDDLLDWVGDEALVGKRLRKDGTRNKLTYPALLGVEEAKHTVEHHVRSACNAIKIFPTSHAAEILMAYAQFLQNRKK